MNAEELYRRYITQIEEAFNQSWNELLKDKGVIAESDYRPISLLLAREMAYAQFMAGLEEGRRITVDVTRTSSFQGDKNDG